jgi:hypothetical protein
MTIATGERMLASDLLDLTFFPVGSILMMDGSWTDGRGGWYICDGRNTPHGKTPNLIDRFIRGGATNGSEGGSDTGSANITLTAADLPAHSHPLSGTLTTSNESQGHEHIVIADGTIANDGTHNHSIADPGHRHGVTMEHNENYEGYFTYGAGGNRNTYYTESNTTGVSVIAGEGSHGHTFTGKQVTSGGVSKNHTHTVTLNGSTENSTNSSSSVPISISTVPVYYTMIYIKKMA